MITFQTFFAGFACGAIVSLLLASATKAILTIAILAIAAAAVLSLAQKIKGVR